jgi:hypothetical protein
MRKSANWLRMVPLQEFHLCLVLDFSTVLLFGENQVFKGRLSQVF